MHPLCYFTVLCSLSFLPPVLSMDCNDSQYAWPMDKPTLCCEKCPPGTHMDGRSKQTCDIECKPCIDERYTDTYNVELTCENCKICDKPNMVNRSHCSPTHNAVCGCKANYRCKDGDCTQCEPIPATTTRSTPPSTTTAVKPGDLTTPWTPPQPIRETVWFLVIIALLCAGIALLVVTKLKPFLRWLKSKHGYFLAKGTAAVPPCSDSEDEDVSKPVQEVLGKCDV